MAAITSLPHVTSMVPIQPGRAVGKRVFHGDGGAVVVLAIAAGSGLDDHRTPTPLLLQALAGEVIVTVEGEKHRLCPGDLLHLPANQTHAVHADADAHLGLFLLG